MKRFHLTLIGLALTGLPILAQAPATTVTSSDPPFWTKSDAVVKDADGKILSQEIRDRKNYTVKFNGKDGKWIATYHFLPHTDHLVNVETSETNEESLYDDRGQEAGYKVQMGSLSFTGRSTRDGVLSAPGLPSITVHRDMYDRVVDVRMDDKASIATYAYDNGGYLRAAIFDGHTLSFSTPANGMVNETFESSSGQVLLQAAVHAGRHAAKYDCSLDTIAEQFGLGKDWPATNHFEYTPTNTIAKLRDSNGKVVLYLLSIGRNRIGFDAAGHAVFYDIYSDVYGTYGEQPGAQTGYNPNVELDAVVPKRLVITSDGRVGACVEGAATGAVASLWTKHGGHLFCEELHALGFPEDPPTTGAMSQQLSHKWLPHTVPDARATHASSRPR